MNGNSAPELFHEEQPRENPPMPTRETRAWWVLRVLADGTWHQTVEFCNYTCGTSGLRRLTELRAAGWPIEGPVKIEGSAQFKYRLNLNALAAPLVMR